MDKFKEIEEILNESKKETKTSNSCKACNGPLFDSVNEGFIVCTVCGLINETYYVSTDSISRPYIGEDNKTKNHYTIKSCYKRTTHIVDVLNNIQGKTLIDITKEEYNKIKKYLKNKKDPTLEDIQEALIKLDLKKFISYAPSIYHQITGKFYLIIKPSHEAKIIHMFKQIQYPYDSKKPDNRKNILRYTYIIYKICELLGYKQYLPYFPLLKSKFKLKQYDEIWKKICRQLNWKYYKTI